MRLEGVLGVVRAEAANGGGEGRVRDRVGDRARRLDDEGRREARGVERSSERKDVRGRRAWLLIPQREEVDRDVELAAQAREIADLVLDVFVAKIRTVADPGRNAPTEGVCKQGRVAALRLANEPRLVAAQAVAGLHARVAPARLGAVSALHVAANLDFEQLHRGAEGGAEEQVEYVGPLRLRVIHEQARARAGRERAVAIEAQRGARAVQGDLRRRHCSGAEWRRREQ